MKNSSLCFTIGEMMSKEYSDYFNKDFYSIMNSIEIGDYCENKNNSTQLIVSYFGSIHTDRWKMIIRLAEFFNMNKFNNIKIIFIRVRPKYFFGYRKERYGNFNIFIAEKEKALIDSALFKKISFSEICSIIKNNLNILDTKLFLDYLIKIKNKTLIKRFSFLFDKLDIDVYKKIKRFIDSKYVPLDYALPTKGKKDRKWRVIENAEL